MPKKAKAKENSSKTWYSMTMAANKTADIHIYDSIGYWGVTAKQFAKDLKELGSVSKINLHVNSPGGDVFDGTAIFNLLKNHDAEVESFVEGVAASMGSVVALSADRVCIAENAYFMIHNPSTFAWGDEHAMDRAKKLLSKVKNTMTNLYSSVTGMDPEEVSDLMDDETWYTGSEALEAGFADELIDPIELEANFDLSNYSKAPQELVAEMEKTGEPAHEMAPFIKPSAVADFNLTIEDIDMPKKNEGTPATDKKTGDAVNKDELKAEFREAEANRKKEIRAIFEGFKDQKKLLDACLDDLDCDVTAAKDKLIEALGKGQEPTQSHQTVVSHGRGENAFLEDATLALSARAGLADKDDKKAVKENALLGYSLFEMARMALELKNQSTAGMSKMDIVAAAFTHTGSDFTNLLANTANKAMLKGYTEADEVFNRFCGVGNLPDFKTISRVDTGTFPALREVGEAEEYKYITLGERHETAVLATYGELFSITRQAIINDDLGAFTRIPTKMGRAAVRTVGNLVFDIFLNNPNMSDGVALFHASHNNLASASLINTAGLDAARVLLATQKDGDATLNIRPKYLLVGSQDESAAKVAVEAEFQVDGSAKNSRQPNSARGIAEVISDARLTAAHDSWYLLADQNMHDTMEVLYLDGNSAPVLEQQAGWNVDGTQFKVRIDAAAKAWDYRTMVKTPKS